MSPLSRRGPMSARDRTAHSRLTDARPPLAPAPSLLALLALAALAGCAPFAPYRGSAPAPAAAPVSRPTLAPESPDPSRHWLGTIHMPQGSDSLVVLLFGDNRPGYRMQTHATTFNAVAGLASGSPGRWLLGLGALPVFVVQGIVPTLDGPRDVIARITRRPTGGNEAGVLRALEAEPDPDLLVNLGDLVTDGRRGRLWDNFVRRSDPLRRRALFLAVPGNHERTFSPLSRRNWNTVVGEPFAPERYWYAAEIPEAGVRLMCLDSNLLTDPHGDYPDSLEDALSDEQLAWADSMLRGPAPIKLVLLHHPLVSAGAHPDDFRSRRSWPRLARLLESCRRARVTAVFASHEHLYQRAYLRAPDGTGFWHLTSGGAGSPLYRVWKKDWLRALFRPLPGDFAVVPGSERRATEYHYCRMVIRRERSGTASIPVEVMRVDGRGHATLMDSLDLTRPPENWR